MLLLVALWKLSVSLSVYIPFYSCGRFLIRPIGLCFLNQFIGRVHFTYVKFTASHTYICMRHFLRLKLDGSVLSSTLCVHLTYVQFTVAHRSRTFSRPSALHLTFVCAIFYVGRAIGLTSGAFEYLVTSCPLERYHGKWARHCAPDERLTVEEISEWRVLRQKYGWLCSGDCCQGIVQSHLHVVM